MRIPLLDPCAFYRPKRLSKALKIKVVVVLAKVTKFGENQNSAYARQERKSSMYIISGHIG